jgi:hypothetical protein
MKTWRIGLGLFCGIVSSDLGAAPVLAPGDCWSYAVRPGEEQSYVVIRKVETYPSQGTVVHISVFGLKLKIGDVVIDQIPHLTLGAESMWASLREKVTRSPPETDWLKHYQIWHQRFGSKGRPPVSHAPLRDVLRDMEKMNRPRG